MDGKLDLDQKIIDTLVANTIPTTKYCEFSHLRTCNIAIVSLVAGVMMKRMGVIRF